MKLTSSPRHSARISARTPLRTPLRAGAAAVAACFITGALANPTDPTVVNGTASFNQAGNVLTVTNSNGAAINWNSFSIAAGETTRFVQPSASSSVLNRVLGPDPSAIYGTLSSNGRVWLVNPAGILVGPGGRIDVAGFVASTLNVSTADFLANKLSFNATPGAGDVVNQGEITTPSGGAVYLVGANVSNAGIITTPQGETILAAGQTVSLIDTATPGVKVDITGAAGNATNLGQIVADAGRIGIAGVIVRNSGTLSASSAVSEGGKIFLRASQDAYVDGDGRIVTTGTKGGSVEVLGDRVAVMDNASIDASGTNGGGKILVGGDYQGKNPDIQNASITYFGPNASLKADAQNLGAGGTVIVWADDTTRAYGSISARGGANGGNGGFVETSGHRYLAVDGIRVDTRAPQGATGNWLLDPDEMNITSAPPDSGFNIYGGVFSTTTSTSNVYAGTIESNLSSGNVTLQTSAYGGIGNGSITASGVTISSSYGSSLTLAAYGGGSATGNINITNSSFYVYGGVTMLAGWDGAGFASSNAIAGKGDITIKGSQVQGGGGAVNLWAGHSISLSSYGGMGTRVQGASMDVAAQNLELTGGYGGVSLYSDGTQNIAIYGGWLELLGGNGASSEYASIEGASQNITFYGGGTLNMKGGSVGSDNYAEIGAFSGDQVIHAEGVAITLTGGDSGGTSNNTSNDAGIDLNSSNGSGSQTVYAGSIVINGGSATYGGAGFSHENSNSQTFYVTGDLTMNGGSSSNSDFLATPVYIGSEYGGGTINVNVDGGIFLNGGSSLGGGVLIGGVDDSNGTTSVTLNAGNNITATGNTGGVWLGVKNLTGSLGSSVNLHAGSGGYGGNINLNGKVAIQTDDSAGSIDLSAQGDGLGAYGDIVQTGGSGLIAGKSVDIYADGKVDLSGTVHSIYGGYIYLTSGGEGSYAGKYINAQLLEANGSRVSLYATGPIFANTMDAGSIDAETDYNNTPSGGIVINNTGAAQPTSVDLIDNATANRSISFTHTGSDLTLDSSYHFETYDSGTDTYNGSILVAAPTSNLTYDGASFYGSSVILAAGGMLDVVSSLYSDGALGLVAPTVNVTNYVSANSILSVAAGTLNNMTSSGSLSAGTDLNMIAGNINGEGGAHFQAGNNINATVANNITLIDGAHFHAGGDINLALAGAGSTVSLSNASFMHAGAPTTIHIDFATRTSGGIFIDGVETIANNGPTGFFVGLGSTPAVPGAGLEITYANQGNQGNQAILAILDSNSRQAGETEEERRRRLHQTDDNGEHHDPADKPVAQCS